MKKHNNSLPMVGGTSLLVIFAVLCLTIFALLSLSTAQASARLSRQSAEAVSAYYAADTQAEILLAQLREEEQPAVYSYVCAISDTQELQISVELLPNGNYRILRWQSVSTTQWQADESIDLWDGNE